MNHAKPRERYHRRNPANLPITHARLKNSPPPRRGADAARAPVSGTRSPNERQSGAALVMLIHRRQRAPPTLDSASHPAATQLALVSFEHLFAHTFGPNSSYPTRKHKEQQAWLATTMMI